MFKKINNFINKKMSISQVKLFHTFVFVIFLISFGLYIVFKMVLPQFIVGGENSQLKNNYKIKVNESSQASSVNYKYIFGDEDNCFKNFPLGAPELNYDIVDSTALFCYGKYAVQYNTSTKTPVWESHVLQKSDFTKNNYVERTNDFREDENIKNNEVSSKPSDYTRTGYDRGHLAPAGDFAYNEKYMSESFIMTNIAPQAPQNNRGNWSHLEQSIRKLLKSKNVNELYVTTGILYYQNNKDKNSNGTLGEFNGIKIPTHFYKIIIEPQSGYSAAYLIPNTNQDGSNHFSNYLIKISDLEKITQINFHPNLDKQQSQVIEVESGRLNQVLSNIR